MEKIAKFQTVISSGIITLALIVSSLIFSSKITKNENITVTGSAYKIVKSDSAKLSFSIRTRKITQKDAFLFLKKQVPEVEKYLLAKGIKKEDIDVKSVNGYGVYKQNDRGYSTNEIIAYEASQIIEIKSNNVLKVKEISTDIQNLINNGIYVDVHSPEYFYSDLASIKIELLKEEDSVDLTDYFVEKAEEMSTNVEFISTETDEGMQLFRAFGGIAAILRYHVEY